MKLYTKIINEETKEVLLINQEEAKLQNLEDIEVDFSYNGKAYLKGYAPVKTLEELKGEKIQQLKNNCQNYIYSIYPIYKQLNISNILDGYTEEDKQNMNSFINSNRNIYKEKKELINNANSQEEIDNIDINFK